LETVHATSRHCTAHRRIVRVLGTGLGYSDKPDHGRVLLSDGVSVDARDGGAALAALAADAVLNLVPVRAVDGVAPSSVADSTTWLPCFWRCAAVWPLSARIRSLVKPYV
jgi:hypothetical protein